MAPKKKVVVKRTVIDPEALAVKQKKKKRVVKRTVIETTALAVKQKEKKVVFKRTVMDPAALAVKQKKKKVMVKGTVIGPGALAVKQKNKGRLMVTRLATRSAFIPPKQPKKKVVVKGTAIYPGALAVKQKNKETLMVRRLATRSAFIPPKQPVLLKVYKSRQLFKEAQIACKRLDPAWIAIACFRNTDSISTIGAADNTGRIHFGAIQQLIPDRNYRLSLPNVLIEMPSKYVKTIVSKERAGTRAIIKGVKTKDKIRGMVTRSKSKIGVKKIVRVASAAGTRTQSTSEGIMTRSIQKIGDKGVPPSQSNPKEPRREPGTTRKITSKDTMKIMPTKKCQKNGNKDVPTEQPNLKKARRETETTRKIKTVSDLTDKTRTKKTVTSRKRNIVSALDANTSRNSISLGKRYLAKKRISNVDLEHLSEDAYPDHSLAMRPCPSPPPFSFMGHLLSSKEGSLTNGALEEGPQRLNKALPGHKKTPKEEKIQEFRQRSNMAVIYTEHVGGTGPAGEKRKGSSYSVIESVPQDYPTLNSRKSNPSDDSLNFHEDKELFPDMSSSRLYLPANQNMICKTSFERRYIHPLGIPNCNLHLPCYRFPCFHSPCRINNIPLKSHETLGVVSTRASDEIDLENDSQFSGSDEVDLKNHESQFSNSSGSNNAFFLNCVKSPPSSVISSKYLRSSYRSINLSESEESEVNDYLDPRKDTIWIEMNSTESDSIGFPASKEEDMESVDSESNVTESESIGVSASTEEDLEHDDPYIETNESYYPENYVESYVASRLTAEEKEKKEQEIIDLRILTAIQKEKTEQKKIIDPESIGVFASTEEDLEHDDPYIETNESYYPENYAESYVAEPYVPRPLTAEVKEILEQLEIIDRFIKSIVGMKFW